MARCLLCGTADSCGGYALPLDAVSLQLYAPRPCCSPFTAGFDVWMGNTRGNTYSRGNVNGIYPYQPEFWYFSIDQLALVDLPTTVDFALATSGASKLAYVGHSQVKLAQQTLTSGVKVHHLHLQPGRLQHSCLVAGQVAT